MKVLHLLKSTAYSGAENVAISIMQHFPEDEMIYASPDGPIRQVVEQAGLTFYPLSAPNISAVKTSIMEFHPDVIHAHDFSMSTYAAWASNGIPVVAHLHNNPPWSKTLHPKTILFLLSAPRIKKIITVSPAVEQDFLWSSTFASKITALGNVVDAAKVIESAKENSSAEPVDVLFLGRFSPQKCPLLFCRIIEQVKKELPDIHAAMIGEGELRPEVERYIAQHALSGNIKLLGFQSNPYPYLAKAKLLLMPSAWEGFGLVAVEALCLGKPVVCSGTGGLVNIVNNCCGAICQTMDDYANAIYRLLSQDDCYQTASLGALAAAERYCDWEDYKRILKEIYKDAISK